MAHAQFSVLWSNNASHTRNMSRHRITLRGMNDPQGYGFTARNLHLDQVHIIFRPNADITPSEYTQGDSNTKTWRAETAHLFVRTMPGNQYPCFSTGTQDGLSGGEVTGTHASTGTTTTREPCRSLVYSTALSLVPNVEGDEDYWCRTYRPVRDLPLASFVNNASELSIELLFPLLFNDTTSPFTEVPNYRILKVLCEFSVER